MLLWVTRSSPFNLLTAQRLRAMGHGVLISPLFEMCRLQVKALPWTPDLIAFTSTNGVRHHPYEAAWANVAVFAVGDATAAAAQRCGYRNVQSAQGNVHDLQTLILRSASVGTRAVHFGALEPAGDVAFHLRQRGFDALGVCVYEASPHALHRIRSLFAEGERIDGIVIHSPKGGSRVDHRQQVVRTGVLPVASLRAGLSEHSRAGGEGCTITE